MFDLTKYKDLLIKFKTLYLLAFVVSLIAAVILQLRTTEKYAARFSVAPHYEFANDLGIKLNLFCNDLVGLSKADFQTKYNFPFNNEIVLRATAEIERHIPNHSFKHIYNQVYIELSNGKLDNFKMLDSFLVGYVNDFVIDTNFSYRGIQILKSKLNDFILGDTTKINNYNETVNYYQTVLNKDNIVASDSLINRILISQLRGEIINSQKNNFVLKFCDNINRVDSLARKIQIFLLVSFLPVILLYILMASKLE